MTDESWLDEPWEDNVRRQLAGSADGTIEHGFVCSSDAQAKTLIADFKTRVGCEPVGDWRHDATLSCYRQTFRRKDTNGR